MRTRILSILTAVFLAVTGASMVGCDPGILPSGAYVSGEASGDQEGQSGKVSLRAGGGAQQRPIEDFVDQQGTFCFSPDYPEPCEGTPPDCVLFVDPIENFIGWSDPALNICASVDYAGLADQWITEASEGAVSFDTQFSGSIRERALPDGRAEVRVILHTSNALTWVIDGWDYAEDPLLFGYRAPDVLYEEKNASVGDCFLELVFINTEPGADLPDMIQLMACPEPEWEMLFLAFRANIRGELREPFGVPDGTPGRVQITQTGLFMTGFHGAVEDGYPVEHIKLRVVGQ